MSSKTPAPETEQDAERRKVAFHLSGYMHKGLGRRGSEVEVYAERIRSGDHDDFMAEISTALEEQSRLIAADLSGESTDAQSLDIPAILFMHDLNLRASSILARQGQQRAATVPKDVLARLDREAADVHRYPFVAISELYPPCVAPLDSLEVIRLSELTAETHHYGKALLVARIGTVVQNGIETLVAVQDVNGDAEAVELYHGDVNLTKNLPLETFFFIKEPYFTLGASGLPIIRIDHLTDLVHADSRPEALSVSASKQEVGRTASEWKEVGNDFFTKQEYFRAGQAYQSALDAGGEGKLRQDISRNLAQVDLILERHEQARLNAINALSNDSHSAPVALDVKAYFRAASASYQLRDFRQCQEYLTKLLSLSDKDEDGSRLLEKLRARLKEGEDANYNLNQLVKRVSRLQPLVDIANFTKRTIARTSKHRGRGLFAAEHIRLGELILCEKAFSATFGWKSDSNSTKTYDVRRKTFHGLPAALWMSTVQKLQQSSPQRIAEVTSLSGRYPGLGSKLVTADGVHVLDAFQIHDIIAANAFAIPTPAKKQKTEAFGLIETVVPLGTKASTTPDNCALFTHASLINHSCLPNASRVFIGDAILLRATIDIPKGDEILQAYVSPTLDVKARQDRMNLIWNFTCSCALCKAETREPEDLRQRRAAVVEEADRLAHDINTHLVDASQRDGIIRRAERLHARLKATFASEIWDGLPRAGMSRVQTALAGVYSFRKEYTRCRGMIVEAFDCLGWVLKLDKAGTTARELMVPKVGCATCLVEEMVWMLATAYRMLSESKKDRVLAEQVRELARTVYIALNGVEMGIDKIDVEFGDSAKSGGIPIR
ncbi:hypothetical protein LTR35_012489 [Friedmanniomyces endolithicus]|uniref:SET domain-containing protein n=1 Tax=Friedmanniomyces endolithicus TaxID=329885 RepID=A0AAN6JD55_9PEZI|nr:hypothetical protein LTR35_012489 [Friedmanniomyces endolithicus]KAK0294641.1 hypothetical protein LTS00_006842 [Friedmanniomyces endolithicus]KAK0325976.1 hypothetical protein LTR82_002721 [Friedmanniomyces endolithicus]KAK1009752.1 hypothetical protein LTR54_005548 [Friedmanniomyces endolithicus]